jgi:hypothetical protein
LGQHRRAVELEAAVHLVGEQPDPALVAQLGEADERLPAGNAPVGLCGKFTQTSRVFDRKSVVNASRSSAQPSPGDSTSPSTSAPVAIVTDSIDW